MLAVPWPSTMVDISNPFSPLPIVGEIVLDSPLCGELMKDMEELEDISRSFSDDTFDMLYLPDFQESSISSSNSTVPGTYLDSTHQFTYTYF